MIPQKLSLKNFLSYQQLTLSFAGLQTACICGANGAGKSSLLEAITWAIWGQSRAETEDDLIHVGAKEAQVDFIFTAHTETYRVIRTRPKGSAGSLEFQILHEDQFRSLTERGLRATQQVILAHLKMDYDTFINSAYLRQGRADEFMLKRPSDRKQVLADLLNLNQYDDLTEKAKDIVRDCKAEITVLANALVSMKQQILEGESIEPTLARLNQELSHLQTDEIQSREQLQALEQKQQQRQTWLQQLGWQQQQQQKLEADLTRSNQQLITQQQQLSSLEALLGQAQTIDQNFTHYQDLTAQELSLNQKFQQHQKFDRDRQQILQQLASLQSELKGQLRHHQAQLEALIQQQQELQVILDKSQEIEVAYAKLQQARTALSSIDQLQSQSAPLFQRRQILQNQIDRETVRLTAKLDEFQRSSKQLSVTEHSHSEIRVAAEMLDRQIILLQKKQVYQQRVHDKGLERRDFLERLKERTADCEERFNLAQTKLQQLTASGAPCPLCDRPLDRAHWQLVHHKHEQECQDLQAEIWVIKEQQAASDCEIQVLREEYRQLVTDLRPLTQLLEQKGNLQAQLTANANTSEKLQQLEQDITALSDRLTSQNYANEAQEELKLIDRSLVELNYDDKNHALARSEVERWRWSEIKRSELKQARQKSAQFTAKIPEIQAQMQHLTERLAANQIDPELQQRLEQVDRSIGQIGYDSAFHQQLRTHKEQSQPALFRYQEFQLAKQQYPAAQQQCQQTQQLAIDRTKEIHAITSEIAQLQQHLSQLPDPSGEICQTQDRLKAIRSRLDDLIGKIGKLTQVQQQLTGLIAQAKAASEKIAQLKHRQHIHQELQQAFGKNGIQALMIETVLPQVEIEANRILAQLSDSQLNVRFITQKAGKKADKVIDTLEISIADNRGTRPYETYSGGEAFRINFAVRLALSHILAQRLGGTLQTLIIDEGFGTQDQEGCDRLVSAINSIADDFACILVITHMPQLKEAFNVYLEVTKTDTGSQVHLVV